MLLDRQLRDARWAGLVALTTAVGATVTPGPPWQVTSAFGTFHVYPDAYQGALPAAGDPAVFPVRHRDMQAILAAIAVVQPSGDQQVVVTGAGADRVATRFISQPDAYGECNLNALPRESRTTEAPARPRRAVALS